MIFKQDHGVQVHVEWFKGELVIDIHGDTPSPTCFLTRDQAEQLRDLLDSELRTTEPSMDVIIGGQLCKRPIERRTIVYKKNHLGEYTGESFTQDVPVLRHAEHIVMRLEGPPEIVKRG